MDGEFGKFETPLSPLRFQSQLGKETKRMYKEGKNIVKLTLARVVTVNYKYNTVDVITTIRKNSTVRNSNNNGKFSARLPVSLGGRTPDGKVYDYFKVFNILLRIVTGKDGSIFNATNRMICSEIIDRVFIMSNIHRKDDKHKYDITPQELLYKYELLKVV